MEMHRIKRGREKEGGRERGKFDLPIRFSVRNMTANEREGRVLT